jgi:hypothetical protein
MGEIRVKGVLKVLGEKGDERVSWDPDDASQVTRARTRFDELARGRRRHNMFLMDETGKKGKQISDFDPSAGAILAIPALQGG